MGIIVDREREIEAFKPKEYWVINVDLDTETEEKILKNIKEIRKNKTTIIVSHRISTVKRSDKIIILKNGKIIQSGTHKNLIHKNGYYRNLNEKQKDEKQN